MNLNDFRREYLKNGLRRDQLDPDPIVQFEQWLEQAIDADINDPTAMTIATVDPLGQPRQRIVLLKEVNQEGFVFFTNYESKKARDISGNPKVSLHFPWHALERQVKVTGRAEKISRSASLKYFLTRPKESQLAAWSSAQSSRISTRNVLSSQFSAMKEKFSKGTIPLPDFWGGFQVAPDTIEFWQGGASRLHDRFLYTRTDREWQIDRLAP